MKEIDQSEALVRYIQFAIDNGYITPLDGKAPFGVHKPWANKGGAYGKIKEVCKEVEVLKNLQGVDYV